MKKLIGTDFRPAKPWGWVIGLAALINRFRLHGALQGSLDAIAREDAQ